MHRDILPVPENVPQSVQTITNGEEKPSFPNQVHYQGKIYTGADTGFPQQPPFEFQSGGINLTQPSMILFHPGGFPPYPTHPAWIHGPSHSLMINACQNNPNAYVQSGFCPPNLTGPHPSHPHTGFGPHDPANIHQPPVYTMIPPQAVPWAPYGTQNAYIQPNLPHSPSQLMANHISYVSNQTAAPVPPKHGLQAPVSHNAAKCREKPPITCNSSHIGRLTTTANKMLSCARGVKRQSQEAKGIIDQALFFNVSHFDKVASMAEAQIWRLGKVRDTFGSMSKTGFGKSKGGRQRLKELQQLICKRKAEVFRFKKYVKDTILDADGVQLMVLHTWTKQEMKQKKDICDKLSEMECLGQILLNLANGFTRELLEKFEENPEVDDNNTQEPKISEIHLLPTQQEVQEIQAERKYRDQKLARALEKSQRNERIQAERRSQAKRGLTFQPGRANTMNAIPEYM